MNALELLRADHERITELFERIQDAGSLGEKRDIFELIRDDLMTHARVEETVFYPAFKTRAGFEDLFADSYQEHAEILEIINELETSASEDEEEMDELIDDLQDGFDHHVDFEENELFSKIEELLTEEELNLLGHELIVAKQGPACAA